MKQLTVPLILTHLIFLTMLAIPCSGQVKVKFIEVKVLDNSKVSAKVFVRNLGSTVIIRNQYSNEFPDPDIPLNFAIRYNYIQTGRKQTVAPNSVTIKNILGGSRMMPRRYEFTPTGSDVGENWEVIFSIPEMSDDVEIQVMGNRYHIGDMPQSVKYRQKVKEQFEQEKDTRVFDYSLINPVGYQKLLTSIEKKLIDYEPTSKSLISSGSVRYQVNQAGVTTCECESEILELCDLFDKSLDLVDSEKFGYSVKSKAQYDFRVTKGKFKTKYKEEERKLIVSPAVGEKIENRLIAKLHTGGLYRTSINSIEMNHSISDQSEITVSKLPTGYLYIGGVLVGILIYGLLSR
ncbi:MAG: hypothetical protein JXQ90_05395 [Cyclobacteriaceae bacterium]